MSRRFVWLLVLGVAGCGGGQDVGTTTGDGSSTGSGTSGGGGGTATGSSSTPTNDVDVTPVETGVDENKVASELTDEEVEALCDEIDARVQETFDDEAVTELSCTGLGIVAGLTAALGEEPLGGEVADAGVDVAAAGQDLLSDFDTETAQEACAEAYDACDSSTVDLSAARDIAECTPPGEECDATVGELEECFTDLLEVGETAKLLLPTCERLSPLSLLALLAIPTETPESCAVVEEKCPGQYPTDALAGFGDVAGMLGGGAFGQ